MGENQDACRDVFISGGFGAGVHLLGQLPHSVAGSLPSIFEASNGRFNQPHGTSL